MPPWSSLIIFVSLGWNFLTSCILCQSWQRGRNCGDFVVFFFFFKILHVRGRNTCLYKGEICFMLLGGVLISFFFYTGLMTMLTYIVFIFGLYIFWCRFFHLALNVLFLFYLYTHISHLLYTIYYLCFTLRCRDEFCLKYFRNTSCQNLLAINSFLTNFFKSLC